ENVNNIEDSDEQQSDQQDNDLQFDVHESHENDVITGPSYSYIESAEFGDEISSDEISDDEVVEDDVSDEEKKKNNKNPESEEKSTDDPLYELFQRVFVNDFWCCTSLIEKLYYSAGIFPDMCYLCSNRNVTKPSKGEQPMCVGCDGKSSPT
ncbi:8149_t:CDS:1, partial [Cetraspora pellucida]